MISIKDVAESLHLKVLSGTKELERGVTGAYMSDLLSDVMGKAREGQLWITMQSHNNIVAVASLKDLAAIIIVNGEIPVGETLSTSEQEGVVLLSTHKSAFEVAGLIYKLFEAHALV